MRFTLKPLLFALLGALLLLQPLAGMEGGRATAAGQAERALIQWLGGPVALCRAGEGEAPRDGGDSLCHPCCPPGTGRGPVLLPFGPVLPRPDAQMFRYVARLGGAELELPMRQGPQQPRAPPQRA